MPIRCTHGTHFDVEKRQVRKIRQGTKCLFLWVFSAISGSNGSFCFETEAVSLEPDTEVATSGTNAFLIIGKTVFLSRWVLWSILDFARASFVLDIESVSLITSISPYWVPCFLSPKSPSLWAKYCLLYLSFQCLKEREESGHLRESSTGPLLSHNCLLWPL